MSKHNSFIKNINITLIALEFLKAKTDHEFDCLKEYLDEKNLEECLVEHQKNVEKIDVLIAKVNTLFDLFEKSREVDMQKIFNFEEYKLVTFAIMEKSEQLKRFSALFGDDTLAQNNQKTIRKLEESRSDFAQAISFVCGVTKITQEEIELDIQQYKRDNNLN